MKAYYLPETQLESWIADHKVCVAMNSLLLVCLLCVRVSARIEVDCIIKSGTVLQLQCRLVNVLI